MLVVFLFNLYILCGLFVLTDDALHSYSDIVPVQSYGEHDFITNAVADDDGASGISDSADFYDVCDECSDMSDRFAVFRLLFVSFKL